MSQYKIIVKNKALSQQWELPFKSCVIDWRLNSINTAMIYVDFVYLNHALVAQETTAKALFESEFMNVYIYSGDTLLFAGFISGVRYQKYTNAFNVEISVKSWLAYFENRYYTATIAGTDAGTIAWNAINSVNDIGITSGTITATKNRDRTYKNDAVSKIVIQLTKDAIIDGYDFSISNSKAFNVSADLGNTLPEIRFGESNVYDWSVSVGLVGSVFTDGIILGGGIGQDQLVRTYDAGTLVVYTTSPGE